jgi:hypothetical protein
MNKSRSAEPREKAATKKKPYRKPSYRSERVFETMALSCGKIAGTQGSCQHNRKVS